MKPFGDVFKTVILTTAASLALAGCSLLPEEKVEAIPTLIEPPPSRAVTYPVEKKRIVEELRGLARVAPTLETDMYFTQSGRLSVLNVEPGQRVSEGELLAQLETGSLEHQLAQAEIDLEMARLRLKSAQPGGTPVEIQLQELSVQKSELNVENLRDRIDAATIRAPHDGVIQSVRGQVGQIIDEYDTLLVVADPTALEIQVEMRRREDIEKIARGQDALVEVSRDNWVPAKVVQITEETETAGTFGTYMVHIELEDPSMLAGLNLGDLLSTRIIVREKEDALVIPRAALREFMGRRYVRLLDGDARREVDVEVGIVSPTEVEILDGISEGDLVIGQ